jgi:hypothetical protein
MESFRKAFEGNFTYSIEARLTRCSNATFTHSQAISNEFCRLTFLLSHSKKF